MLVKKFLTILFVISLFSSFPIFAQKKDKDSLQIQYFSPTNPFYLENSDTSLSNLIFYQPNSSFTNFAFNSGNIGQAFAPLFWNYSRSQENVFHAFDSYFLKSDSVKYYYTSRPYTEFVYTQGLTNEHLPSVFHTQRFNSQMGVTLNYRVISSEGTYSNQATRGHNFYTAIDFHSKKGRYISLLDFVYNSLNSEENGGLSADDYEDFISGDNSNRLLYETNLSSAVNIMRHKGVAWKNYWFCFGKTDSIEVRNYRLGLFNELNITSSSSLFKMESSTDVLSFNSIFIDSTQTRDSLWLNRLETFAGLTFGNWNRSFYIPQIKVGYKQQWNNVSEMNSGFFAAELNKAKDSLSLKANFQIGVFGRRTGDMNAQVNLGKNFRRSNFIGILLSYGNEKPAFFDNYFITNHHLWNNDFKNIEQYSASGKIIVSPLSVTLEGGYQRIANMIFFDINADIKQSSQSQNLAFLSLLHTFKNKWLRSRTFARYQLSSETIRIPQLLARQEIAFLINHKAIHAEAGLLGTYVSNFFANAYDPSIRDYYLQNKNNVGGLILVDFFAALRVGSAKLYFKVDHFNAGFRGNNYELIPFHPLTDVTIKLGIKWTFWN